MGEFDNYFQHIDSISHKDRAKFHQDIYQIIDEESCDMNFDFESEAHRRSREHSQWATPSKVEVKVEAPMEEDDFVVDLNEQSIIPIIEDAMSNEQAFGMKRATSDLPSNSTLGKRAADNEGCEFFIDIPMEDDKPEAAPADDPKVVAQRTDFMNILSQGSKQSKPEAVPEHDLYPMKVDK